MSEFLTAGFTLHFIKDILDKIQTGYVMIDFMITSAAIMCMNRDTRTFLKNRIDAFNLDDFHCSCFNNQIEYRLSSIRKTNYEGSFNVCHEKIFSICEYINTRIKSEDDIDLSKIQHFEEFIVNEDDGYCEDESIMVPIGKISFENKGIRIENSLQNKEMDEKHGKKTEYKQIEISVYGKNHNKIQKFIEEAVKEYNKNLNLISNEEIRWFRLRKICNERSLPIYFSKKLEHKAHFDNLFFDNKDKLLMMLDDLSRGQRDKICLLLHGPPGSGKDSVVVAITKYLSELNKRRSKTKEYKKRHIVAYPLDLFSKSDDFMRVFYGTDKIDDKNIPNELQVKLFPEVEKYSDIMLKKDIKEIIKEKTDPKEADKDVFEFIQKNSELELSKDDFELISMIKNVQGSSNSSKNMPELKLAPIIECLDSFMNQRGTIVIFTTNLPLECIDDVLIRHERLDKFYLGPSSKENAYKILDKHFGGHSETRDFSNVPIGKLMPSDINYYCKITESIDECIEMLKKH